MKLGSVVRKDICQSSDLAGIQYHGLAGITQECVDAIKRLIQFGDKINRADLLTFSTNESASHAFVLTINDGDKVAIKSGFSSGYGGTGASGLATILRILRMHGVKIQEYDVEEALIERLDSSCLLYSDLQTIERAHFVRPTRYMDYIVKIYPNILSSSCCDEELIKEFPACVPFGLMDARLIDLAMDFFNDPDAKLLMAYRCLEETVKNRAHIKGESGIKLFSAAFQGKKSVLYWEDEHAAKANMFSSVYGAYRNPRAHKVLTAGDRDCLREFFLINELFHLESAAVERPVDNDQDG